MDLYSTPLGRDRIIRDIIEAEQIQQNTQLQMIASENYQSKEVMMAVGSVFGNRYSEGYPGKRYYGGQDNTDSLESVAQHRAKQLFGAKFANVQPHSGSQANAAAYMALLEKGDTILAMDLSNGGHLTHGSNVNFSGKDYNFVHYGLDEDGFIDYNNVKELAEKHKPKLIVAGASAYPREIDFVTFKVIADTVNAKLMVDMAHIAGLVAAGYHPTPVGVADVITSTTHKTLRGARGGLILTDDEEIYKKINSAIFPGLQGGPLMNQIAGKAVAFEEASTDQFKRYIRNVIDNTRWLAEELIKLDYKLVSGGTDNHLVLVDLTNKDITGKEAQSVLERVGIICNKNTVPNDSKGPFVTSGIRLGMAALTTRNISPWFPAYIAKLIDRALMNKDSETILEEVRNEVREVANTLNRI